jgi:phage FluMu protein Com
MVALDCEAPIIENYHLSINCARTKRTRHFPGPDEAPAAFQCSKSNRLEQDGGAFHPQIDERGSGESAYPGMAASSR